MNFNHLIIIILIVGIVFIIGFVVYKNQNTVNKKTKKVKFNDNVELKTYQKNNYDDNSKINVDKILENIRSSDSELINSETIWDDNFDVPLISQKHKNQFEKNMQIKQSQYEKSLDNFSDYQLDNSTIIHPDSLINPINEKKLIGKSIKDIYDEKIKGIHFTPADLSEDNSSHYS